VSVYRIDIESHSFSPRAQDGMQQEHRSTDAFFVQAFEPEDAIEIVRERQKRSHADPFHIKSVVLQEGASRVLTRSTSAVIQKSQQPIES
jgi:hypothetical protein